MLDQRTLKPRTIFCHDNLPILRGINSNSIDLIYLDPPFNKGKAFHAPIGTTAEGASFTDIWYPDSVDDAWHNQINDVYPELYTYLDAVGMIGSRPAKYYLIYMAVRLMEMKRILKDTGSVYLHCDSTASHYLKLLMDVIFGHQRLINEIVWCYYGPSSPNRKQFNRKTDTLFWYAKSERWTFNNDAMRVPYKDPKQTLRRAMSPSGSFTQEEADDNLAKGKLLENWWVLRIAARSKKEFTGYPTQKPLALLERIVKASSKEGDVVLDPFCGCATSCIAAEKLERQWIGIDVSAKAYELVQQRLKNEIPPDLFNPQEPIFREDVPHRTDIDHKRKITTSDKEMLFGKQNGKCKGCGTLFEIQHLEVDHIIPQAHGGSNELENLQLLCGNCNKVKGDRPMEYLLAKRGGK